MLVFCCNILEFHIRPITNFEMDTPRPSSHGLLVFVCLALLSLCGYKVYRDYFAPPSIPTVPSQGTAIAVTRLIDPAYRDLFSKLDPGRPFDHVPRLTFIREGIFDKSDGAPTDKHAVYQLSIRLLDGMIPVAEERTESLEELLKTKSRPRSNLGITPMMDPSDHFMDLQLRRGNDALKQRKLALDSLWAQLQDAEREWNRRLPKNSLPETYKVQRRPPLLIQIETNARLNPLDQTAYDHRPWRRVYYDQYGYPRTRSR